MSATAMPLKNTRSVRPASLFRPALRVLRWTAADEAVIESSRWSACITVAGPLVRSLVENRRAVGGELQPGALAASRAPPPLSGAPTASLTPGDEQNVVYPYYPQTASRRARHSAGPEGNHAAPPFRCAVESRSQRS